MINHLDHGSRLSWGTVRQIVLCVMILIIMAGCSTETTELSPSVSAVVAPTETDRSTSTVVRANETDIPETATDIPIEESKTPTIVTSHTAYALAESGVSRNGDWTPYIEEFDGVEMVLVPAGCFQMGSQDGASDELPIHEVCFEEPFWMDMYEVTNEQYGAYGTWPGERLPRETVDWTEATAHCESRAARLPTEAEWEYAARGPDNLSYPWGNVFDGLLVNYCDQNCSYDSDETAVSDGYDHTAPVGSYPGGVSWIGAFDLSGNVWEWVNDWYGEDYYHTAADGVVNPQGPSSGENRVNRGGSWYRNPYSVRATNRSQGGMDFKSGKGGFRCARAYQP